MSLNWKQIIEGWRNNLFPSKELKHLIEQTQQERLSVCLTCPFNSTTGKINSRSTCKACGCPLKPKTACLSCECPEHKWLPVASKQENEDIYKQINQEL